MSFLNLPETGAPNFKPSVLDFASLPPSGNTDGDVRVAKDTGAIYVWNENSTSWVSATGGSGLTNLNGQTGSSQSFALGTSGSDLSISSALNVHTFNVPDASATARGVLTTGIQSIAGNKTFNDDITVNGSFPLARRVEVITLTAPMIVAKSVVLIRAPATPSNTELSVTDAPNQTYSTDFTVSGSTLSWNGLGLDGILESGDILTIVYN